MEIEEIKTGLDDNTWYYVKFGRKKWLIKRINSILFGFKADESYYSKKEQKEFVKFSYKRYLHPIIVFNKFIVDDIIYKEIDITIEHKKHE